MFERLGKFMGRKPPQKGAPLVPESSGPAYSSQRDSGERKQTYSKIFRWRLPDGYTEEPGTVELVGSFTQWKRVPLLRDGKQDSWHAMIHHIEGNRTHHYMLLLDGKPTHDKTCDGLAVPHGHQEEQYQLMTDKGPRVFMLFGQAK